MDEGIGAVFSLTLAQLEAAVRLLYIPPTTTSLHQTRRMLDIELRYDHRVLDPGLLVGFGSFFLLEKALAQRIRFLNPTKFEICSSHFLLKLIWSNTIIKYGV